jgi:hypothetical protein
MYDQFHEKVCSLKKAFCEIAPDKKDHGCLTFSNVIVYSDDGTTPIELDKNKEVFAWIASSRKIPSYQPYDIDVEKGRSLFGEYFGKDKIHYYVKWSRPSYDGGTPTIERVQGVFIFMCDLNHSTV